MTFKYVSQIDERDCGVAALSMILNKYGQTNSLASLRALAKTDLEGTTALGIVRAADAVFGVISNGWGGAGAGFGRQH